MGLSGNKSTRLGCHSSSRDAGRWGTQTGLPRMEGALHDPFPQNMGCAPGLQNLWYFRQLTLSHKVKVRAPSVQLSAIEAEEEPQLFMCSTPWALAKKENHRAQELTKETERVLEINFQREYFGNGLFFRSVSIAGPLTAYHTKYWLSIAKLSKWIKAWEDLKLLGKSLLQSSTQRLQKSWSSVE